MQRTQSDMRVLSAVSSYRPHIERVLITCKWEPAER